MNPHDEDDHFLSLQSALHTAPSSSADTEEWRTDPLAQFPDGIPYASLSARHRVKAIRRITAEGIHKKAEGEEEDNHNNDAVGKEVPVVDDDIVAEKATKAASTALSQDEAAAIITEAGAPDWHNYWPDGSDWHKKENALTKSCHDDQWYEEHPDAAHDDGWRHWHELQKGVPDDQGRFIPPSPRDFIIAQLVTAPEFKKLGREEQKALLHAVHQASLVAEDDMDTQIAIVLEMDAFHSLSDSDREAIKKELHDALFADGSPSQKSPSKNSLDPVSEEPSVLATLLGLPLKQMISASQQEHLIRAATFAADCAPGFYDTQTMILAETDAWDELPVVFQMQIRGVLDKAAKKYEEEALAKEKERKEKEARNEERQSVLSRMSSKDSDPRGSVPPKPGAAARPSAKIEEAQSSSNSRPSTAPKTPASIRPISPGGNAEDTLAEVTAEVQETRFSALPPSRKSSSKKSEVVVQVEATEVVDPSPKKSEVAASREESSRDSGNAEDHMKMNPRVARSFKEHEDSGLSASSRASDMAAEARASASRKPSECQSGSAIITEGGAPEPKKVSERIEAIEKRVSAQEEEKRASEREGADRKSSVHRETESKEKPRKSEEKPSVQKEVIGDSEEPRASEKRKTAVKPEIKEAELPETQITLAIQSDHSSDHNVRDSRATHSIRGVRVGPDTKPKQKRPDSDSSHDVSAAEDITVKPIVATAEKKVRVSSLAVLGPRPSGVAPDETFDDYRASVRRVSVDAPDSVNDSLEAPPKESAVLLKVEDADIVKHDSKRASAFLKGQVDQTPREEDLFQHADKNAGLNGHPDPDSDPERLPKRVTEKERMDELKKAAETKQIDDMVRLAEEQAERAKIMEEQRLKRIEEEKEQARLAEVRAEALKKEKELLVASVAKEKERSVAEERARQSAIMKKNMVQARREYEEELKREREAEQKRKDEIESILTDVQSAHRDIEELEEHVSDAKAAKESKILGGSSSRLPKEEKKKKKSPKEGAHTTAEGADGASATHTKAKAKKTPFAKKGSPRYSPRQINRLATPKANTTKDAAQSGGVKGGSGEKLKDAVDGAQPLQRKGVPPKTIQTGQKTMKQLPAPKMHPASAKKVVKNPSKKKELPNFVKEIRSARSDDKCSPTSSLLSTPKSSSNSPLQSAKFNTASVDTTKEKRQVAAKRRAVAGFVHEVKKRVSRTRSLRLADPNDPALQIHVHHVALTGDSDSDDGMIEQPHNVQNNPEYAEPDRLYSEPQEAILNSRTTKPDDTKPDDTKPDDTKPEKRVRMQKKPTPRTIEELLHAEDEDIINTRKARENAYLAILGEGGRKVSYGAVDDHDHRDKGWVYGRHHHQHDDTDIGH